MTKGVGKRGTGKVCPSCGLSQCFAIFLSLSTLCFVTMLTVVLLAAGRPRPRPAIYLPVILLHVNPLLSHSSKRDFPRAVDYLPYVPGYQSRHCCHFFLLTVLSSLFTTTLPWFLFLLFATHSLRRCTGRWSFSIRLFKHAPRLPARLTMRRSRESGSRISVFTNVSPLLSGGIPDVGVTDCKGK